VVNVERPVRDRQDVVLADLDLVACTRIVLELNERRARRRRPGVGGL
jgi:hypothetical protein